MAGLIRVEGFGWLGSNIGLALERAGLDWCWHDLERPSAWRASTGCVYPESKQRPAANLRAWMDEYRWHEGIEGFSNVSPWLVGHRHPPDGRPFVSDLGPLRQCETPALVVNVPGVVERARSRFAARQCPPGPAALTIEAHGFGAGLQRWGWGWSALAKLDMAQSEASIYVKPHRFATVYAYARPDLGGHLIGSDLIRQARPERRDTTANVARWVDLFSARVHPVATVVEVGEVKQGWRPIGDGSPPYRAGNRIHLPSLAGNGIRFTPEVVAAVMELVP